MNLTELCFGAYDQREYANPETMTKTPKTEAIATKPRKFKLAKILL